MTHAMTLVMAIVASLRSLLGEPAVHRLGWELIHSLWQGVVVAAVLAVTLRMMRRRSTTAREQPGRGRSG